MKNQITATFKTRETLEHALIELEKIGIEKDQITIIATEETRNHHTKYYEDVDIENSAAQGATSGSLVGGVLGGLVTATALALPGINLVVGGALAATLLGAGAGAMTGAVAGGLLGALGGYGVSEADAKFYEKEIMAGSSLLMVSPEDETEKAKVLAVLNAEKAYRLAA